MRILFVKPFQFSENGYSYVHYEAGKEYDVSNSCSDSAIMAGVAEKPGKEDVKPEPPKTAVKPQPKNK